MEWQPIETAPKDNTSVLLYGVDSDHDGVALAFWGGIGTDYEGWYWFEAQSSPEPRFDFATHWMPLPAPPAA